ncbi:MAG: glycosyltransferase [Candidatus Marinimicrobia bacterium]|nr:glycosyltransferase [Candidatus Neomarinimicrobiota bacterium]
MSFDLLDLFESILFFSALYYAGSLFYFIIGLSKEENSPNNIETPPVSVIIAVRNGEKNINRLLNSLKNQTYNGEMEFIIVDDESTDRTVNIIQKFTQMDPRFKYLSSKGGDQKLTYKKRALDSGIKNAQFEHLLFTDIDCIIQYLWVENMMLSFTDETDYLIGYSEAVDATTSASKFQKADFFMLLSAARGMANNKSAWACTGQNQGYRKSLYSAVGGFSQITEQLQGDDSLFLLLCRKAKNINVNFANSPGSFVISRPDLTWIAFLKQRIRWAGDSKVFWKFNLPFYFTSIATFILNMGIIVMPLIYGFTIFLDSWYMNILLIKFIAEYILIIMGGKAFHRQFSLINFLQWYFIQPLYVAVVSVGSILNVNRSWQGRKS